MTLADDTTVLYQMSSPYVADSARGVRWDDPALAIEWPLVPTAISERDRSYPPLGRPR
jgi:dTDP-4-dehydrorhamnose 3,5-epimerase